jgi:nucleoid-associated protein YgaU
MVQTIVKGVFGVVLLAAAAGIDATPALAAEMAAEGEVIEHRVRKGDNLSLLAGYYYRNPRLWKKIYRANSSDVADPNVLIPGDVLKITTEPAQQLQMTYSDFLQRVFR